MARSRKYGWNGEMPAKALSGQALIVFNGMKSGGTETMLTGKDWTELIGGELKTRQDPYRVVLYYILILKARGVIKTEEFDISAVTKKDDTAHAVTVKSTSHVDVGLDIGPVDREEGDDIDDQGNDDGIDEGDPEGKPEEIEEVPEIVGVG